jgi:N-methylhydantoinase B
MDHAETMARRRTRTIPDGVYEAESYMDDDGIELGKPVPIRVRVTVKGDEMTVDLSEVSKQVRGFYNSGITTGHACAQVAYKCITSPRDYPINDGSFRSLKTIVPPGRVISAVRPAPMRWWMTYPMTVVDTIFKALAPAIPDRVIAGHHADLLASSFHGINARTCEFFIGSFGPLGGGWGAKMREDGVSATVCINDGDTHNSPNEQAELSSPLWWSAMRRCQFRRRRPSRRLVSARQRRYAHDGQQPTTIAGRGDTGGLDGTGNAVERIDGKWKTDFPNAKVLVAQLGPGDVQDPLGGGGGRWPLERPIAQVRTMSGRGMSRSKPPRTSMVSSSTALRSSSMSRRQTSGVQH